jgi:dihydrofolate reductase
MALNDINIECVVAIGKKLGIGVKDDKLPWHIPEDMKYFKELTTNHIVIMGHNTFRSLNCRALKNRVNIVFTRDTDLCQDTRTRMCNDEESPLYFVDDLNLCTSILLKYKEQTEDIRIFIIGGEQVYRLFEQYIDIIYLTEVYHDNAIDFESFFFPITHSYRLKEYTSLNKSSNQQMPFRHFVYCKDNNNNVKNTPDHTYLELCSKV